MMDFKTCTATFTLAFGLIFAGCNQPLVKRNYSFPTAVSALSKEQSALTANMFTNYLYLKDALVATNAADADQYSVLMKSAVIWFQNTTDSIAHPPSGIDYTVLRRETDSMLLQLDAILQAKNDNCELKRIHFKPLSDIMYTIIRQTDLNGIHAYRHYCPMAMNEKGAYWLSVSPDIENPYFGQKMLTCGELVDTLR